MIFKCNNKYLTKEENCIKCRLIKNAKSLGTALNITEISDMPQQSLFTPYNTKLNLK